jgi:general L-amino acid transport system permease protein
MATAARPVSERLAPPRDESGFIGWLRKNLFNTWYNTILTLLAAALLFTLLRAMVEYVFVIADWRPITFNPILYLVGQFPIDQLWRVGASALLVSLLLGVSWRTWGKALRGFALAFGIGLLIIAVLPENPDSIAEQTAGLGAAELAEFTTRATLVRVWLAANLAFVGVGYVIGARRAIKSRRVLLGWLLSFVVIGVLLRGVEGSETLPPVDTTQWGGLLLNLILALSGIVASFPLGVLLALGRRGGLPVVKLFCTLFIEVVRGVPLVTILFMGSRIIALFLPEDVRFDLIARAWLGITLFSAAYMAENVRGGLQSVPAGQVEAAKALGLNGFQTTLLIVLPQALRNVIPVIVGQFVSLFKDTTLVVVIAMLDILGIGKSIVLGNVEFIRLESEVFFFIAAVFWIFNYSMTSASRRLEEMLGVGKR